MFRTLTNHDFYKSLVDVKNEEDHTALSFQVFPTLPLVHLLHFSHTWNPLPLSF